MDKSLTISDKKYFGVIKKIHGNVIKAGAEYYREKNIKSEKCAVFFDKNLYIYNSFMCYKINMDGFIEKDLYEKNPEIISHISTKGDAFNIYYNEKRKQEYLNIFNKFVKLFEDARYSLTFNGVNNYRIKSYILKTFPKNEFYCGFKGLMKTEKDERVLFSFSFFTDKYINENKKIKLLFYV